MVKGVSKMVIEVNNTGSELFEKVVFYVTPKYGNLSAKQLKRAASTFSFNYDTQPVAKSSLRRKYRLRRRRILCILGALFLIAVTALIIIL